MIHKVRHFVSRFIEMGRPVVSEVDDDRFAAERLSAAELRLWTMMDPRDRRHSVQVAKRFTTMCPSAVRAEVAGALLHDVGKAATDLGRWGRAIATILPLTRAMIICRDHERLGGRMLAEIGSEHRTIELVDGTCNDEVAQALRDADDA